MVREHISQAVVGGAIVALTGFAPEHWFAEVLKAIHIPETLLNAWPASVDARLAVVSLGIAIIVGDVLWRRRTSEHLRSGTSGPLHHSEAGSSDRPLALPDKPSIAVLPFENMSGDPEQEYFADGIAEEIITALSRFRQLFVIARNSTFTYKGHAVDVRQVSRELGVRYVLEGSVRKSESRVRITAQLVDALTGAHLWVERFDAGLNDVFELQDRVTESVVGALLPKLEQTEIERAKRKPTESLDAYDYYLRALPLINRVTKETNEEALRLLNEAIRRDADFALAHARAAQCYTYRRLSGWMVDRTREIAEAARLARVAVVLDKDDALVLSHSAMTLGYVVGDLDEAATLIDRALALNSNLAIAWRVSGWVKICLGEQDTAIKHEAISIRLSPLDSFTYVSQFYTALAYLFSGQYDQAVLWAEKSLQRQPNYTAPLRVLAASNALRGRLDEAQNAVRRLLQLDPERRISNLGDVLPPFLPKDRAKMVEALRKAGLPE
jgi:TolB-like protein